MSFNLNFSGYALLQQYILNTNKNNLFIYILKKDEKEKKIELQKLSFLVKNAKELFYLKFLILDLKINFVKISKLKFRS